VSCSAVAVLRWWLVLDVMVRAGSVRLCCSLPSGPGQKMVSLSPSLTPVGEVGSEGKVGYLGDFP